MSVPRVLGFPIIILCGHQAECCLEVKGPIGSLIRVVVEGLESRIPCKICLHPLSEEAVAPVILNI